MDAAFQAVLGVLVPPAATAPAGAVEASGPAALPFAVREFSVAGACGATMWAWVRDAGTGPGDTPGAQRGVREFDIDVCDEGGAVRVRVRGLSLRLPDTPGNRAERVPEQPSSRIPPLPHGGGEGDSPAPLSAEAEAVLRGKTAAYLTKLVAAVTGVPGHRLEADASLGAYGMDSVMAMQLISQLEKPFGPLSKTLLFEYPDVRTLTDYFVASHAEQLPAVLGIEPEAVQTAGAATVAATPAATAGNRERPRFAVPQPPLRDIPVGVAVIGLAGRYPKANTLDEFWDNLRSGRDCITEVPPDRWDHGHYFDPDKNTPGKAYSKWGGFLDEVDRFDPLFFNIPPRDTEIMDPQERLFLECTWHLLENAGHTKELLRARYRSLVGVYVGAMSQQYHAFDADPIRGSAIALSSYYSIANRVSHFFDLQGPSMAVDTACSSALVAVHMACESLLKATAISPPRAWAPSY
jgi:acyl carrier protein